MKYTPNCYGIIFLPFDVTPVLVLVSKSRYTAFSGVYFFLQVEAKELTTKGTYAFDQFEHYPHAFQPVVDNNTAEPFFPKDPYDLLLEGKFNKVNHVVFLFAVVTAADVTPPPPPPAAGTIIVFQV